MTFSINFFDNLDDLESIQKSFMGLPEEDQARINRYMLHWKRYANIAWEFARDDGSSLASYNLVRKIADKHLYWLIGKGMQFGTHDSVKPVIGDFVNMIWNENSRDRTITDMCLTGGVTGDVFVLVTNTPHRQSFDSKFRRHGIHVQPLASETVFPRFDGSINREPSYVEVRTPFYDSDGEIRVFIQKMYPAYTREYIEGFEDLTVKVIPNPLGEIPIVHIPNLSVGNEYYGVADITDIVPLNEAYNEKATDIEDIIFYAASPLILLFGAKAGQLERGPKSIWSGLPETAKAQMLEMSSGTLDSSLAYLENLYKFTLRLGDIPAGSLGDTQPISNTSGVALHTQYLPLLERASRKAVTYEEGFKKLNYFILRWGEILGHIRPLQDIRVCKHCGGRILEVEEKYSPAKLLTDLPNVRRVVDGTDTFKQAMTVGEQPIRRDKCFEIEPDTLDVADPLKIKVKILTDLGFAVRISDLERSALLTPDVKSYWYKGPKEILTGDDFQPPESVLRAMHIPEEPETATVVLRGPARLNEDGDLVRPVEGIVESFIVPTSCPKAEDLNLYDTEVEFISVLPRDDHLQATLWQQYQNAGWITPEEAKAQIPQLAAIQNKPQQFYPKIPLEGESTGEESKDKDNGTKPPVDDKGQGQMSQGKDLERSMTRVDGTNSKE